MSRQRADIDTAVRAWLVDGVSVMPERMLDDVLEQLPSVSRRRRWRHWSRDRRLAVWMVAAAATMILAVGIAMGVRPWTGDPPATPWRTFPIEPADSLTAGPYLIDDPFPVRIGLTVPSGWHAAGVRSTLAALGFEGGGLIFTIVEGVYADPCHLEEGLVEPRVGPRADDLASALARLPGLAVSGPTDTRIDGLHAVTLTLTAPTSFESCTEPDGGPLFRLWGAPEWHWLDPGERNRLWIVEVAGTRLVISAEEQADATPAALAALNEAIASIDIEPPSDAAVVGPIPGPTPRLPRLPAAGSLAAAEYQFSVRLHRYTADGVPVPLAAPNRGIVTVPQGWSAIGSGIRNDGEGGAQVSIGAAARIFHDPCHWQSSSVVDRRMLATLDGMAAALSDWIAGPEGDADGGPAPVPEATEPMDIPRYGQFGRHVALSIPRDVVLADCDGGEYRLWEDLAGRARSAREPGERIDIWVVDYEPGLLVVDASVLPAATAADLAELEQLLFSLWVFPLDEAR
jgi:hypothetical protein